MRAELAGTSLGRAVGRVVAVRGVSLRLTLPGARLGDIVTIRRRGESLTAEIVGFEHGEVLAVALGELRGVGVDDVVESAGHALEALPGGGSEARRERDDPGDAAHVYTTAGGAWRYAAARRFAAMSRYTRSIWSGLRLAAGAASDEGIPRSYAKRQRSIRS